MMQELTKAEEQVMHYIWKLKKCFLKDIVEMYPDPKPAYTTVSTVVRTLVKKEVIGFKSYGKVNEYYPLISKQVYSKSFFKRMVNSFFNSSTKQFASFFTKQSDLSIEELEELKTLIDEQLKQKQQNDTNGDH